MVRRRPSMRRTVAAAVLFLLMMVFVPSSSSAVGSSSCFFLLLFAAAPPTTTTTKSTANAFSFVAIPARNTYQPVFTRIRSSSSSSGSSSSSSSRDNVILFQSSSSSVNGKEVHPFSSSSEAAQAGEDGYSVMRQPANWDLNSDPVFDVPDSLLDDDENRGRQLDDEWWSLSKQQRQQKPSLTKNDAPQPSPSPFRTTRQQQQQHAVTTEEDLDLMQRSLDTLDYPRVLDALYQECTTVPAKRLVLGQLQRQSNNRKTTSRKSRAYDPLTADTVQGSQERYRAVQELQWLLEGGNGRGVRLDNDSNSEYTYKNRLGYKESLVGRSPPFSTAGGFNLDAILDLAAQSNKVLEGPELLDVSVMLDALENIQLWNQGLKRMNATLSEKQLERGNDSDSDNDNDSASISFVQLPAIADCINVNATLQDLLHNALDEKGRLSGTTFPTIGQVRARVRALKTDIMQTLDALLATPSIQSKLNLESGGAVYSQVAGSGRLVIPVEPKYASGLGMVHDTSRSGKTVYVEPHEIVASTNELRQAEGELRAEEARVWRSLTQEILMYNRHDLETAVAAVGQLDLVLARYRLGRRLQGVVPVVQDEGVIRLCNAKHPVLLLRGVDNVVGSDIELGSSKNQGLVLTGPNAGGKTVILKLLGLLALMARSGIPVPAQSTSFHRRDDAGDASDAIQYQPRVDFFSPVLADIGDMQSVGGDLSTFSGHMLVCREVLNNSGRNALVLMDELGSGTDPNQGVAIAQALLEAVIETGARVAITTHYLQLKQLAASDDRFSVAGMQFVNGRPTYKLLPGTVGESFALAVAERLGLPQRVLDRANALLDSETRAMGDLIREMEYQKALVDQKAEELEQKRIEMTSMELRMKEEKIRLEKKQLDARRQEARKFAKMLEEKEAVLEGVLEKLKSDPSRRVVAKSWDEIRFVKRDALNDAENVPSVMAQKQKAASAIDEVSAELVPIAELREKPELKNGDKLVVCKQGPLFAREAMVTKSMGNRVEVKVNNMTVVLKLSQVAMPTGKNYELNQMVQYTGRGAGGKKGVSRKVTRSKAADRAIAAEGQARSMSTGELGNGTEKRSSSGVTMRTQSNTVDVRGLNLSEAQAKVRDKFSSSLMNGRPVVYILHGHGTGGVLKSKIRGWLKSEKLVQNFGAADLSDGGDALTRVGLR